jgi:hypothetical protein
LALGIKGKGASASCCSIIQACPSKPCLVKNPAEQMKRLGKNIELRVLLSLLQYQNYAPDKARLMKLVKN